MFGASGQTGREFIRQATERGLVIIASCRATSRTTLPLSVEARIGELGDPDHAFDVIAGTQAVCCVVGPRPPHTAAFCADATATIIAAMHQSGVRRFVCLTGAMIGTEAPNWTFGIRLMARMFRRQRPAVALDRMRQETVVIDSGLEWTLVKPPRLTDGVAGGNVVVDRRLRIGLLSKISRADLATFLINECVAPRHVRQAVYVSG